METQKNTPKLFFIQIGIIASLYTSVISFLTFIFSVIDNLFPEQQLENYYIDIYNSTLRTALSTLIIAFPLFIYLSRIYRKNANLDVQTKEFVLRKWLLYFTLFISGLAIAVDLVILTNNFLGGEAFVTSFILKVLSVFIVCSSIFYFYLKDIKNYWYEHPRQVKLISSLVSFFVLTSVIGGFMLIGSPTTQRNLRQDSARVNDLQNIQWNIVSFYQSKTKLPEKLEDIIDSISNPILPKDPETKEPYQYKKITDLSFEICATFALPSINTKQRLKTTPLEIIEITLDNWSHESGLQCFKKTVDPDRYPQIK